MSYPNNNSKKSFFNKIFSTIEIWIRSAIFFIYGISSILIHSLLVFCVWGFHPRYRHNIIRHFLRNYIHMLRVICKLDYKIEGLEHLPKDRIGIVFSKHQSTWETFFLPLFFHQPAIILKRELLWVPFFGWGLAASDPIAINRNDKRSSMQQIIEKGKKYLDQGRWVLIFPEGTRMPPGVAGKYKLGGARLAEATGYPVLPVAHNAGEFWPKKQFIKRPGVIHVVIGPMIESKDKTAEEILELAKTWIENTMMRISSFVDKPSR